MTAMTAESGSAEANGYESGQKLFSDLSRIWAIAKLKLVLCHNFSGRGCDPKNAPMHYA